MVPTKNITPHLHPPTLSPTVDWIRVTRVQGRDQTGSSETVPCEAGWEVGRSLS